MKQINPAFDTLTKTWYVTSPVKCEAPTIRELLRALRKLCPKTRCVVKDYYPHGAPPTQWPKDEPPPRAVPTHVPEPSLSPAAALPTRGKLGHISDRVLNAWFLGQLTSDIAERHGVSPASIRVIIRKARTRGDPRAVRHPKGKQLYKDHSPLT